MPEKVSPGPLRGNPPPREAVCIHTRKVYDSCRDKECLQDLRVYLTGTSQTLLDSAINVKPQSAQLLWTYIDVEPISYNRGFYTVDVKYFYRVTCDVFSGVGRPRPICGLATYDKRTVLFGSEGSARIFSSAYAPASQDIQNLERTNLPVAVVEAVDPVALGCKMTDACASTSQEILADIPADICSCFDEDLVIGGEGRRLFVTLGQFSIIKLERDIQLLMPAYDFCMPQKECAGNPDDPCALFQNFRFPVDEFFPPKASDFVQTSTGQTVQSGGCGCSGSTASQSGSTSGGCGCGNLSRR
ncbi:MAG: hypothetical protein PT965_03210 [Clostridia bacterium]|nr:hypothetical protein [Clostridia bacterium]